MFHPNLFGPEFWDVLSRSDLPGQYPPALSKLIAKRKNFAQLEDTDTAPQAVAYVAWPGQRQDFNRKDGEKSAYTRMVRFDAEICWNSQDDGVFT